jgi:hypothetical protein
MRLRHDGSCLCQFVQRNRSKTSILAQLQQWCELGRGIQLGSGDRRFGDLRNDTHVGVGQLLKREQDLVDILHADMGQNLVLPVVAPPPLTDAVEKSS